MPPHPDFLKNLLAYLKGTTAFTSLPLSLLLIGLEKLVEVEFFLCPCILKRNALLTAFIFIGPALLTFTLISLLVRPFKHKCSGCCAEPNDDAQPNPSDIEQNPSDDQQNLLNAQQNPSDDQQNLLNAQQNPSDDQQNLLNAQQNPSDDQQNLLNAQQNPSDDQQNPSDDQQNLLNAQQNPSDQQNLLNAQQNLSDDQQNLLNAQQNLSDDQQNLLNAQQNSSDAQQNCPNAFASCLIPPVIWICILLLDGKYVACAMTHWKGVYVSDEELDMFWCKLKRYKTRQSYEI
ncbi:hypothetical protein DPX16_0166 [Anabarilius grahami]|uniref:Uncharacterized protein n=1 Tax=Anabarilius grahami TaxID=495550 RepID=A0A3N0YJE0_ANAGA|nr:hypothetical protein DPX16_0166 [Anabarilius grahami]